MGGKFAVGPNRLQVDHALDLEGTLVDHWDVGGGSRRHPSVHRICDGEFTTVVFWSYAFLTVPPRNQNIRFTGHLSILLVDK